MLSLNEAENAREVTAPLRAAMHHIIINFVGHEERQCLLKFGLAPGETQPSSLSCSCVLYQPRQFYSSSSSSSNLVDTSVAAVLGDVPEVLVMTELRAALKLCVVEYFVFGFPKSTLARAFFNGLPTAISAGVSASIVPVGPSASLGWPLEAL